MVYILLFDSGLLNIEFMFYFIRINCILLNYDSNLLFILHKVLQLINDDITAQITFETYAEVITSSFGLIS